MAGKGRASMRGSNSGLSKTTGRCQCRRLHRACLAPPRKRACAHPPSVRPRVVQTGHVELGPPRLACVRPLHKRFDARRRKRAGANASHGTKARGSKDRAHPLCPQRRDRSAAAMRSNAGGRRLALSADREPLQAELWRALAYIAHDVQDGATTNIETLVSGHRHRRVFSPRRPDLTADFGERHFATFGAKSL